MSDTPQIIAPTDAALTASCHAVAAAGQLLEAARSTGELDPVAETPERLAEPLRLTLELDQEAHTENEGQLHGALVRFLEGWK